MKKIPTKLILPAIAVIACMGLACASRTSFMKQPLTNHEGNPEVEKAEINKQISELISYNELSNIEKEATVIDRKTEKPDVEIPNEPSKGNNNSQEQEETVIQEPDVQATREINKKDLSRGIFGCIGFISIAIIAVMTMIVKLFKKKRVE